ncbi:hypothetical protein BH24CHL4_BH24CHL4_04020 [soil metagenome]
MIRFNAHPVFTALLMVSLVGTPVTYRGGAAAPHPHMFLQLWHDDSRGSFMHDAHQAGELAHASHDYAVTEEQVSMPQVVAGDGPSLTVSPFLVSDWGVPVLHAPSSQLIEREQSRGRHDIDRTVVPTSHPAAPEPPPPRTTAI